MINSNKNILFGNFKSINLKKILLVFTMLSTLGISNSHLAIAEENPNLHIKFKAQPNKTSIKAGETFDILVNFEIAKYWYTYGLTEQLNSEGIGPTKTEFTLSNPKLELFGEIKSDKPHSKMDEGFGMKIDYFVGNTNFIISAKAKSDFDLTKDTLSVIIYPLVIVDMV